MCYTLIVIRKYCQCTRLFRIIKLRANWPKQVVRWNTWCKQILAAWVTRRHKQGVFRPLNANFWALKGGRPFQNVFHYFRLQLNLSRVAFWELGVTSASGNCYAIKTNQISTSQSPISLCTPQAEQCLI